MSIPEKAVEAAALALDEFWGGRYAPDAVEELSDEMRVSLSAAYKYIAAQVLREHAATLKDAGDKGCQDEFVGLYEAADITKTRADEMEGA